MKWKDMLGDLCHKRFPVRLKGKFYKTEVSPAMIYESKCWVVDRKMEQITSAVKMI